MERIMNDKNDSSHNVGDTLQGAVVCVSREEMQEALSKMKFPWTFRRITTVNCS